MWQFHLLVGACGNPSLASNCSLGFPQQAKKLEWCCRGVELLVCIQTCPLMYVHKCSYVISCVAHTFVCIYSVSIGLFALFPLLLRLSEYIYFQKKNLFGSAYICL